MSPVSNLFMIDCQRLKSRHHQLYVCKLRACLCKQPNINNSLSVTSLRARFITLIGINHLNKLHVKRFRWTWPHFHDSELSKFCVVTGQSDDNLHKCEVAGMRRLKFVFTHVVYIQIWALIDLLWSVLS